MTEIRQKKTIKSTTTINPIVAGIAGAIAGGAAVAAAVVMSNKDNQKKVGEAFDGAKEKVTDYIGTIKSQPIVKKSAKKMGEVVKDTKKAFKKKV